MMCEDDGDSDAYVVSTEKMASIFIFYQRSLTIIKSYPQRT